MMELKSIPPHDTHHSSSRNGSAAPISEAGGGGEGGGGEEDQQRITSDDDGAVVYRVYKERWFGLVGLMLMNIVISWGWLTYAPVSDSTQIWFGLESQSPVNWLSTVMLFTYVVAAPAALYTLNRHGVKPALMASSFLVLAGNWIRYSCTREKSFGGVMFGQILIGFAQPFVLSAATHYSDLWFTSRGRISATALTSFANPLGAALGQLINPMLATSPEKIPDMTFWVAIIATAASLPWWFVKSRPPTPPCASAVQEKLGFRESLGVVFRNKGFLLVFVMFSVYVGFFNAVSSLLNQIMLPYGYTADEAGLTGAILILTGLVTAAIVSPINDRTHSFLTAIRTFVPVIALSYVALIFAPRTHTLAAPFAISALLGAASFSLLPLVLEWAVEQTHPAPPELTNVTLWVGGQLLGAIFLIVMDALKDKSDNNKMWKSLIFEAVVACVVAPLTLMLGRGANKRIEIDKVAAQRVGA
ncbi:MFS general substrate transporter [Choiromyces venosus 120613-1]|uniref:MFS general substrate transporter n=1 Tax=Choiromyces venosus 120613-1 TaxID=1336337 RepID=A0A3N4K146_9PEZI|nr:MFS general substrate transporter [Choiromyces venosus 120613-1]